MTMHFDSASPSAPRRRSRRLLPLVSAIALATVAACNDSVDLGGNDPDAPGVAGGAGQSANAGASGTGANAGSAGASAAGAAGASAAGGASSAGSGGSAAGKGGAAGKSTGGAGGAPGGSGGATAGGSSGSGASGASGGATGGSAGSPADPCPPVVVSGSLSTFLDASDGIGVGSVVMDIRPGATRLYELEDPWVRIAPYDGAAPLTSTLPLNQNARKMAVITGSVTIPPSFQTSDKLMLNFFSQTGETVLVLKSKDGLLSTIDDAAPALIADGTDVYWALRAPARVVEAELAPGGAERVIVDYPDASGVVPTALAVDSSYVYFAQAKPQGGSGYDPNGPHAIFRAPRHGAGPATLLATPVWPVDQLLVENGKLHAAYARFAGSGAVTVTYDAETGKELSSWGGNQPTTFRISRMAVIGKHLYWTEYANNTCEGRLLRRDLTVQTEALDIAEELVKNVHAPSSLIAHEGALYFATTSDPFVPGSQGAIRAYVPPADGACHGCKTLYETGAVAPVCPSTPAPYNALAVCAAQSCFDACSSLLLDTTKPPSSACKACLAAPCASQIAACQADG